MRLLGISGSLRKASRNTALLHEAARLFDPKSFELADIRMPLYDGDLEDSEGVPEIVHSLHAQIIAAGAVIIATPEYNYNLPGVLKNALDWVSRVKPKPFNDKPLAIMSAAGGTGVRGQYSLRHCLTSFNPRILQAPEVAITKAGRAFDENGRLVEAKDQDKLQALMDALKLAAGG